MMSMRKQNAFIENMKANPELRESLNLDGFDDWKSEQINGQLRKLIDLQQKVEDTLQELSILGVEPEHYDSEMVVIDEMTSVSREQLEQVRRDLDFKREGVADERLTPVLGEEEDGEDELEAV